MSVANRVLFFNVAQNIQRFFFVSLLSAVGGGGAKTTVERINEQC